MALFLHGIFGLFLVLWVRSRGLAFAIPLTPSHGLWAVFVGWNGWFWGLASPSHRTHPWNDSPLAGFIENSCRSFRIYYLSVFVNGRRLKVSNVAVGNSFGRSAYYFLGRKLKDFGFSSFVYVAPLRFATSLTSIGRKDSDSNFKT